MSQEYYISLRNALLEQGADYQFYFDSYDITDIIKGVEGVYGTFDLKKFDKRKLESEKQLVHSLASAGLLGNSNKRNGIRLLPPHQSELYNNLDKGFGHIDDDANKLDYIINDFFREFKIQGSNFEKLKQLIYIGQVGFRLIQFNNPLNWTSRFRSFFKKTGKIEIYDYDYEDFSIKNRDFFHDLLSMMNQFRNKKQSERNNYNDALALYFLHRQVQRFNNGEQSKLPVFFDSQNFISHLEDSNLISEFNIHLKNGKKTPSIRNSSFFQVYSLLLIANEGLEPLNNTNEVYRILAQHQNRIDEFILQLRSIDDNLSDSPSYIEVFKKNDAINSFNDSLKNYIDTEFFRSIVLPCYVEENQINALAILKNNVNSKTIVDKIQDRETQETIRFEVNMQFEKSKKSFELLSNIQDLYMNLKYESKNTYEVYVNKLTRGVDTNDIINDFGFTKFFIPDIYWPSIELILGTKGILNYDEQTRDQNINNIINFYFIHITKKQLSVQNLYLISSAFWMFGLYDNLIKMDLTNNQYSHHLWIITASSLLKNARNNESKLNLILQTLENPNLERKEKELDTVERYIGLSYLYFNYWIWKGGKRFSKENLFIEEVNSERKNLIEKSLLFAWKAYESLKNTVLDDQKYLLYSSNVLTYYTVEGGNNQKFLELRDVYNTLKEFEGKLIWNTRYEDTIARYLHREAINAKTDESKRNLLKNAQDRINNALNGWRYSDGTLVDFNRLKGCRDISSIRSYKEDLDSFIAKL